MNKLHKGVKWKFRFQIYFFLILIFVFISVIFIPLILTFSDINLFIIPLIIFLIVFLIVGELFVNWTYNLWKYEFAKDALKIEKGVIIRKYKSIPYERIQNVDITRGVLARIIGFSTIDIQTAGYSSYAYGGGRGMGVSEGHIPGVSVEEAERIREFLIKRISHGKQGL